MQIDRDLLEACLENDRLSQNRLYKLVFSYLMNICLRYKNDYQTAGNSLNSIFLKILNNLDHYRREDSFKAWIKRIAINHLIDEYRKAKRERQHIVYEENLSYLNNRHQNHHEGSMQMESDYLRKMINELPPRTAAVFNLYAIDGYKHREIASLLEISENTSKWHLRDARMKLKARLAEFEKLTAI